MFYPVTKIIKKKKVQNIKYIYSKYSPCIETRNQLKTENDRKNKFYFSRSLCQPRENNFLQQSLLTFQSHFYIEIDVPIKAKRLKPTFQAPVNFHLNQRQV